MFKIILVISILYIISVIISYGLAIPFMENPYLNTDYKIKKAFRLSLFVPIFIISYAYRIISRDEIFYGFRYRPLKKRVTIKCKSCPMNRNISN